MNLPLQNDVAQFEFLLEATKAQALAYLNNINTRPTSTQHTFTQQKVLGNEGMGTLAALNYFNEIIEPIIVASAGPRYWGFVTGGTTPASIVGDWLSTIYDQNSQTTKGWGDVSANIEIETLQLLLDLFQLPNTFFGGFVTGATMSNFTCLAVARQWVGKAMGRNIAKKGLFNKLPVLTATAHSSSFKSLSMLGMGSANVISVKMEEGNRESIDINDLEEKIKQLNGEPFILISSGGTVNTVDFDNFTAIAKLKAQYNFWWHIDAAFGAFAACVEKYKYLLKGWEVADSITIDCHKWLNVPYENAVFFVQEKHSTLQVETFQNANAPYLGNPMENFDYLNFLPENSRRLKALPVWFSLMAYGKNGIAAVVQNAIDMANLLGQYIEQSKAYELLAPVRLNTVCFTLKGNEHQNKVQACLNQLNQSEKVFMTPTVYKGKKGIRAAFVNWRTTSEDIDIAIKLLNNIIL
jgi:glutamate/tyrosine decarboxylase-like PLP-dependent enzyme